MVRSRHARRTTQLALALVAALLWFGCSIEENYEVLSFFFDGVPDPNAPETQRRRGTAGVGTPETASLAAVSAHPAFVERRCEECHGQSANFGFRVSGFTELNASICLKCHSDVFEQHRLLHGPVAAVACLQCHNPHESAYPSLLLTDSSELCLKCHRGQMQQLQQQRPIPQHEDLSQNCLNCHRGHGGDARSFLKAHSGGSGASSEPAGGPAAPPADEAGGAASGSAARPSPLAEFLMQRTGGGRSIPDHRVQQFQSRSSDAPAAVNPTTS